jgi:ketosteroid isomerase-like protein
MLYSCPRRLAVLAALVLAAACRPQPVAVNPNDPEIVAAVGAILDKAVAAAAAIDAEGVLSASTRDDTFTFITADRMLKGYDEALAAFRKTYALLQGQTHQIIERRIRVLSPDVVLVSAVSEAPTPTRPGSRSRPWGSDRRPCSSAGMGNGVSSTTTNPLPNSRRVA